MTDFKTTTWMAEWSERDHQEYEAAWKAATAKGHDTGIRAREWLRLVLDAQQAQRAWADDVLADMQRRGALESWKAATVKPVVIRKGRHLSTALGTKRRDEATGREEWVQGEMFDKNRAELLQAADSASAMSATLRAKSALYTRLAELCDKAIADGAPETVTARQAATRLKIDLTAWCAA